ncbi:MAG TPA: hypothetical protein VIC83_06295 [Candidatus Limnocylindria bacterium]|jgi:hypothetical protein
MARLRPLFVVPIAALALAACSTAAAPSSDAPVSLPPSQASPTPSASDPATGAIVTLRTTGGEEYRILLTDPQEITTAEELAAGDRDPLIPVGTVVRTGDGGVNTGYDWHIDPASFEWAEMTMELCDGRPSYVEDGTLSGNIFCPWSAEVVSVEAAE